jgi:hypothetical protein
MTIDIAVALAPASHAATGAGAAPVQVGYGVSLTDIGRFEQALQGAGARLEPRPIDPSSESTKQLLRPFEHINAEASRMSVDAQAAKAAGLDMSPGEVVMLTVRCQEFMFHCQLTSNIANRASDGLQQLFRQQG